MGGNKKEMGQISMATTPTPVRHFFVVNPVSFRDRREMNEVVSRIHCFFMRPDKTSPDSPEYAVHVSRFPRDAIGAIRRFASAVPPGTQLRVYAVGGDGILFDCLNGIVDLPNVELGTMPYGMESNFYRVFGQREKEKFLSLRAQTSAPSVPMDTLYCGSNHALSYCLIGLDSLVNASAKKLKSRYKFLQHWMPSLSQAANIYYAYLRTFMSRTIPRQNYQIWVDNEDWSGSQAAINIANSPWYVGNRSVVPEAVPSDGWMDVLCSGDVGMLTMFRVMLHYMRGRHANYPELFSYRRAKKVFVTSDRPLMLDLDGEVFYDKYITVEMKPAAVRIIAPVCAANETAPGGAAQ